MKGKENFRQERDNYAFAILVYSRINKEHLFKIKHLTKTHNWNKNNKRILKLINLKNY